VIIRHLTAEHVLKYRNLELQSIPDSGLITISGQNESGKSTIGETVCFALFGRTFSVNEENLVRVIRWGEPRCKVTLGFRVQKEDFEISRILDRDGNHAARLYRPSQEDRPLAKGLRAVADYLHELLGYRYDEFVESFYLAQREITTPHPHSHTIKTMAGIGALERVAKRLAEERTEAEEDTPNVTGQAQEARDDLEALNIVPGHLETLKVDAAEMAKAGETLATRQANLEAADKSYRASLVELHAARKASRIATSIAFPLLVIAILGAALLVAMDRTPTPDFLMKVRIATASFWDGFTKTLPLAITIGAGVISIAACIFGILRDRRVKELSTGASDLAAALKEASTPIVALDTEVEPASESDLLGIRRARLSEESTALLIGRAQESLSDQTFAHKRASEQLSDVVEEETKRRARADSLGTLANDLDTKLKAMRRDISVRKAANELVLASAHHISQRFNRDLRDLASRSLPLFTEGRYEHLQIDDDLNVRVFSSEKRDFVDLDEVSSGTQRQIMLAVRLALSQELIHTTGAEPQFLFLDEPFAFFDPHRTQKALEALPTVSKAIAQIWVIAQEFPDNSGSSLDISCSRDIEELSVKKK